MVVQWIAGSTSPMNFITLSANALIDGWVTMLICSCNWATNLQSTVHHDSSQLSNCSESVGQSLTAVSAVTRESMGHTPANCRLRPLFVAYWFLIPRPHAFTAPAFFGRYHMHSQSSKWALGNVPDEKLYATNSDHIFACHKEDLTHIWQHCLSKCGITTIF